MSEYSKLLINESPLVVQPSLVKLLGFPKAIILQQIQYLLNNPKLGKVLDDGHKYIWETAKEFVEDYFSFWEEKTVAKHLRELEEKGLIISRQPFVSEWNRTKFYRINYENLELCLELSKVHKHTPSEVDEDTPSLNESKTSSKREEERAHAETAAGTKNLSQENHNTLSASSIPKKENWIGTMSSDDAAAYLDRPQIFADEHQTEAEKIYREIFPTILLSPIQNQLFKKIENLDIWRKVCELWRDNGSRASMLGNMVDRYTRDLEYFNSKNQPSEKWNHELAKQPKPKKWSHSL